MDEIIEEIKEIPEITWSDYEIKVDTSMYESALKPLENVSKITTFLIVFLIAVCIVLLILVLRIWIGARKKEVGILLSIGETKRMNSLRLKVKRKLWKKFPVSQI